MPESILGTDSVREKPEVNDSHKSSRARRLMVRLLLLLCLILLVPYCMFRYAIHQHKAQIERLGGKIVIGAPSLYNEIVYPTNYRDKYPDFVRKAAKSDIGHWMFKQFPDGWSIDLREISSEKDVEAALISASFFDNIRRVTLYRSAATDDHLKLIVDEFPNLEHLKINETAITDVGISYLRDHPRLLHLNAQRTPITDAAVADLASIRKMRELNIADTGITSVQPILDANRTCRITHQLVTLKNTTDRQRSSKP